MERIVRIFAPTSRLDFGLRFIALEIVIHAMNLGLWLTIGRNSPYDLWMGAIIASIVSAPFVVLMLVMLRFLVDLRKQLSEQARTDPLTGLPNRRAFVDRMERLPSEGSLIMLDIDHFKRLNDTFGHAAGDECLRLLADRLRSLVRPGDIVARMGGEEFALFLPNTSETAAHAVGARLTSALQVALPGHAGTVPLTSSAGATMITEGTPLDTAMSRADAALYRAKAAGRARMIWDDGGAQAPVAARA
jgi:diguanylate cyclase